MEDKSGDDEGDDQKSSKSNKMNLDNIWAQYTDENEEKFFRKYIKGFIAQWESMPNNCGLSQNWSELVHMCLKHNDASNDICCGPPLSDLPDELLAALSKFLFVGKDQVESEGTVDIQSVMYMREITTCLTIIICQNFENIPLVGSMAFVSQLTQTCSLLLSHLLQMESSFFTSNVKPTSIPPSRRKKDGSEPGKNSSTSLRNEIVAFIVSSCHFFEAMYDPAFRWRAYLSNSSEKSQSTSLIGEVESCPILLHQETIPFLYESFETALVDSFPDLAVEMLNVFGAVISGSRHNALRAISPATTKMILKTLRKDKKEVEEEVLNISQTISEADLDEEGWSTSTGKKSKRQHQKQHREEKKETPPPQNTSTGEELYGTAISCSAKSIQVLHETPIHERQLDITIVIEQYQQILKTLSEKDSIPLSVIIQGVEILSYILETQNSSALKKLLTKSDLIDTLLTLVKESRVSAEAKRTSLLPVVINTISLLMKDCTSACDRMAQKKGYENLYNLLNQIPNGPDNNTLFSLLAMSTHGEDPTKGEKKILSVEPILYLIKWIVETEHENINQQTWLIESLYTISCCNMQNKMLCCQSGVLVALINALKDGYKKLDPKCAMEILKMIETLGQHSISPFELKQLIGLLQDKVNIEDNEEQSSTHTAFKHHRKFPYKSHVIHVISSMARGSGFEVCRHYFDIPLESAGLTVPNIRQWYDLFFIIHLVKCVSYRKIHLFIQELSFLISLYFVGQALSMDFLFIVGSAWIHFKD